MNNKNTYTWWHISSQRHQIEQQLRESRIINNFHQYYIYVMRKSLRQCMKLSTDKQRSNMGKIGF